jgi:rRNA pseudouridine-1189 N-methylase Emg1 (Nep1/Mra1 family)
VNSGTTNEEISPGGTMTMIGERLKVDENENDEGVFFIDATGQDTKVDKYIKNLPSEMIFVIPATLATGDYRIAVRNRNRGRKSLVSNVYPETLEVK